MKLGERKNRREVTINVRVKLDQGKNGGKTRVWVKLDKLDSIWPGFKESFEVNYSG